MDVTKLQRIWELVVLVKKNLDDMEVNEWDEDIIENWKYHIDNVEYEVSIIIDGYKQGKWT